MRKVRTLFYIITILVILVAGLLLSPYFIYSYILINGADNQYVSIEPHPNMITGKTSFNMERVDGIYSDDNRIWHDIPFSTFVVPLPKRHPQINLEPYVKIIHRRANTLEIGASFVERDEKKIFKFITKVDRKFDYSLFKNFKLFSLPLAKNYILSKSAEDIWSDIFTKDLSATFIIRNNMGDRGILQYVSDIWGISYRDLTYALYIYYLRGVYLPKDFTEITYLDDRKMGLVYVPMEDSLFDKEIAFFVREGLIYKFEIFFKKNSIISESIRRRFIRSLNFHTSTKEDAKTIYTMYRGISYEDRIGREGLMYLWSAWTHDVERKEFVREMIQFLERGDGNAKPLEILYQFAYKRFGTNFSKDNLREVDELRRAREAQTKLEKEIEEVKKHQMKLESGAFESDDERTDFYLKKGKEFPEQDESEKDILSD